MKKGSVVIIIAIVFAAVVGTVSVIAYQKFYIKPSIQTQQTQAEQPSVPKATASANPQQSTDETANWKTYTSDKYKFSLKYPANWTVKSPGGGQFGDKCQEATNQSAIIELAQVAMNECGFVADNLPSAEVDITIWSLDKPWENIYAILGTSEKTTIAGEQAAKYKFTSESELPNIQAARIYANHNGKGYLIFIKQKDKLGNYDSIYDQILSTFKFLNQ